MQPLAAGRLRFPDQLTRLEETTMSIDWRDDADAAMEEADRRDVAVLLDFNAAPD